jgi:hypothetical protein
MVLYVVVLLLVEVVASVLVCVLVFSLGIRMC